MFLHNRLEIGVLAAFTVILDEDDRVKAVFACHIGLFQFRVMTNWTGQSPRYLPALSRIEEFAMAYFGDILVFSETPNSDAQNIPYVWSTFAAGHR